MKKSRALQNIAKNSKLYLRSHSSTILTCIGAVGVIITSVTTAKATVKAFELINEAECEKKDSLTKKETVALVGKLYIPPVLIGVSTIACIFGANVLNKKQQAMLSSAYALASTSFKEYKDKVKELYGEETHNNVVDAIAVEKVKDTHVKASYMCETCDLSTDDNSEPRLWYDEFSGRYFETTTEKVLTAEYHLNRNYALRGYSTLNEFYEFLGLEKTDYGELLGWAPLDEGMCWIEFNHRKIIMDDGLQCYILEMPFEPREEYIDEYLTDDRIDDYLNNAMNGNIPDPFPYAGYHDQ